MVPESRTCPGYQKRKSIRLPKIAVINFSYTLLFTYHYIHYILTHIIIKMILSFCGAARWKRCFTSGRKFAYKGTFLCWIKKRLDPRIDPRIQSCRKLRNQNGCQTMSSLLSRLLINTIKTISEDIPVPKFKNSKWPPIKMWPIKTLGFVSRTTINTILV